MTTFLNNPHSASFKCAGHSGVIKGVSFVKLMQQVPRPFDRAGDQLREEHDERGICCKIALRFLVPR